MFKLPTVSTIKNSILGKQKFFQLCLAAQKSGDIPMESDFIAHMREILPHIPESDRKSYPDIEAVSLVQTWSPTSF